MIIPTEQWMPDAGDLNNPGLVEAVNCLPTARGYKQFNGYSSTLTNALNTSTPSTGSPCLGAFYLPDLAGTAESFAGDATTLKKYTNANSTWADVSIGGGYTNAVNWHFEKFGNRVIAVDIGQNPQYYDLATSSNFADLEGSPPRAKYVAAVRDFLVLASIASLPYTVRWSAFNNSSLWTASLATQSDSQQLLGKGGQITGIVGGEYGVIFQERSIWRMDYQGPPTIFRFSEVEVGKGCVAPRSIVAYGGLVYYYDWSGFYVFDGQQSTPIGAGKVDQWFARHCADRTAIQGVMDRKNQIILWGFKTLDTLKYNDRALVYHITFNKWSYIKFKSEFMYERIAGEIDLDNLDTALGNPADGIDADNDFLVDQALFGGELNVLSFNEAHKAGPFSSSNPIGQAEFVTAEIHAEQSKITTYGVRPLMSGTTTPGNQVNYANAAWQTSTSGAIPNVTLYHRNAFHNPAGSTYMYTDGGLQYFEQRINPRTGEAPIRNNARFQTYGFKIPGPWGELNGLEILTRQAGRR